MPISIASLLYIFFLFSLEQYRGENKFAELFLKFSGCVIIPIAAVQFWAIHIVASNSGLHEDTYVSIVLNIVTLGFAVISLMKKGRFLKLMLPVAAGVALIITLTPLNIIDVPMRNQTARLISSLMENDMIADGRIVPNEDVSVGDRLRISIAFRHIIFSSADNPGFLDGVSSFNFEATFGFQQEFASDRIFVWPGSVRSERYDFDVTGFSRFYVVSGRGEEFNKEVSGEMISYNFKSHLVDLYSEFFFFPGGVSYSGLIEIYIGDNKLVLNNVSFRLSELGEIEVLSFSGFFLLS
jgi:hypothetical protein